MLSHLFLLMKIFSKTSRSFVSLRLLLLPVFVFMLRLLLLLLLSLLLLSSELLFELEITLTTVLSMTKTNVRKLEIEKQFLPNSRPNSWYVNSVSLVNWLDIKSNDLEIMLWISILERLRRNRETSRCVEKQKLLQ